MNAFNYSANSMKAVCIFSTFDKYAAVDFFFTVLSIVINLLTCPLVILLNALFITAMGKNRRLQTMHNILLASMAGTDLAVGIVSQPFCIALDIFQAAGGSLSVYCKLIFHAKDDNKLPLPSISSSFGTYRCGTVCCDEIFSATQQHRYQIPFNCSNCMLLAYYDFLLGHLVVL